MNQLMSINMKLLTLCSERCSYRRRVLITPRSRARLGSRALYEQAADALLLALSPRFYLNRALVS
jgi:hypothetical protein